MVLLILLETSKKQYLQLAIIFYFLIQTFVNANDVKVKEDPTINQKKKIEENQIKCFNQTSTINPALGQVYCPRAFDTILCWEETKPGRKSTQPCPVYVIGFENSNGKAIRECESDGKWKQRINKHGNITDYTDYTECMILDEEGEILKTHLPIVRSISKIGNIISSVSLFLAICVLSCLRRLHCARNLLHLNLFVSFLLFSLLQLAKEFFWVNSLGFPKDVIPEHEHTTNTHRYVMNENISHWECKLFAGITRYAESTSHVMVFCEALYLNSLVSFSTFNEKNHYKFYIVGGWTTPILWLIPYLILMSYNFKISCWTEQTQISLVYVIPQCILIITNFILFVMILRVLVVKLRHNSQLDSKEYRYKKLAKSTLILLPLFGTNYILFSAWYPLLFIQLPVQFELIRLYFDFFCNSFQGFVIALIYGLFNSEVRNELIKVIERVLLRRNPNMRRISKFALSHRDRSVSINDRCSIAINNAQDSVGTNLKEGKSNSTSTSKRNSINSNLTKKLQKNKHFNSLPNSEYQEESGTNHEKNALLIELDNKINGLNLKPEETQSALSRVLSRFFRLFKKDLNENTPQKTKATGQNNETSFATELEEAIKKPKVRLDSIAVHEIHLNRKSAKCKNNNSLNVDNNIEEDETSSISFRLVKFEDEQIDLEKTNDFLNTENKCIPTIKASFDVDDAILPIDCEDLNELAKKPEY